jgi:hypothetical protein
VSCKSQELIGDETCRRTDGNGATITCDVISCSEIGTDIMLKEVKGRIFWDVTPFSMVEMHRRARRVCGFHIPDRRVSSERNSKQPAESGSYIEIHGVTARKKKYYSS